MSVALALAVTAAMAAVDYAHAQYQLHMQEHRRAAPYHLPFLRRLLPSESPLLWRAARWSVLQWACGGLALYVTVRVSWWYLPFEGLGLLVGTMIGGSRRPCSGVVEE